MNATASTDLYFFLAKLLEPIISDILDTKFSQYDNKFLPSNVTPEFSDRYLSGEETQILLGGISAPTLWQWRKKGIITGYRLGNKVMYKYSELIQCGKLISI